MGNWLIVNKCTEVYGITKEFWIKLGPKLFIEEVLFNSNTKVFELPEDCTFITNDLDPDNTDIHDLYNQKTGEMFMLDITDNGLTLYKKYSAYAER